jgi:hypothetical protein
MKNKRLERYRATEKGRLKVREVASRHRRSESGRENVNASARARYSKNKDKIAGRRLKKFGITTEVYDAMHSAQGGLCAICRRPEMARATRSKNAKRLAVDHDHVTGKVRALLCSFCNTAIGLMGENPDRVESVAGYLRMHSNNH